MVYRRVVAGGGDSKHAKNHGSLLGLPIDTVRGFVVSVFKFPAHGGTCCCNKRLFFLSIVWIAVWIAEWVAVWIAGVDCGVDCCVECCGTAVWIAVWIAARIERMDIHVQFA